MAHGARLGTVVMFVPDLDRSASFYLEVLGLEVADRSPTAALLTSAEGSQLVLRSMDSNAPGSWREGLRSGRHRPDDHLSRPGSGSVA
jgi:catechol 2,3-dioxygenase-like lactoylglutathione lyase family enzyme